MYHLPKGDQARSRRIMRLLPLAAYIVVLIAILVISTHLPKDWQ